MTPHFSDRELVCRCGCGFLPPQDFQDKCERIRVRYGKPMHVASGGRCPDYNEKVSHTGRTGPHTKRAIDFKVAGGDALEVVRIMLDEGMTGIGISQKGPHGSRFIHGDDLPNADGQPRPWIWSY